VTPPEQIEATQADCKRGYQLEVARWVLGQGGHVRAGLEDNLKYDHTRLADSNAALMAQVAALGAQDVRYPATPAEGSFPALPSRPRREENHE
jgi:uncharacterized protein (DUF849 family)